ncbi:phosphonate utilization associated transcriptional regulator [Variovorax ureilyticus]|uniref:Phosphonate utilization associated transcriptional regulator n=1 Tax=Variovorax ureilyticus TaxID=1836198 RepID=A0ABU8VMK7_9BURK
MPHTTPPSALALLRSSTLPMVMQEEIERLIMTGELPVGSRVNESELAARFNTSRGPIREALRALEEAGLVRNEKNRGVYVREISFEEADEIYELREALEEVIGRRVAVAMSSDAIDRMRAMVEAMRGAAQAKDLEQYAQLNLQFHDTLLEIAGSRKLTDTYKRLVKELHLFRMRALDTGGGLEVSAGEHSAIVEAIASGNPERAGAALRGHVAGSRERMHKAFGRPHAAAATPSPDSTTEGKIQ